MKAEGQGPDGACRRGALARWALAAAAALTLGTPAVGAATLDDVRARGHLICGVSEGMPGFASIGANGAWTGLDIDFCGAVAAAVLGDRGAVKYRVVTPANRFQALSSGEIDLLPRANGRTLSRDTELGVRFADTLFHDGQGFLIQRGYAVASVLELSGTSVCVMAGSSAAQGVETFFQARKMRYQLVPAEQWSTAVKSYADGACTVLTGDITLLAAERSRFTTPSDHVIMPELISKEMLGPVVRQGDEQWFSIVRWTLSALVTAEELGITSVNIDALRSSPNIDIRRFLGLEADLGRGMGLAREWSYLVVRQNGNYGEIFDRNIGLKSPLALERGVNNIWTRGGLLSAGPLR
ncbi:amino acid ABC transporter substrate-binding protein [uncultured Hyphomicrobium sp.]|uniref:amino acid ABC transporter substrate-binding protein n=1 Tax=uncultured Hyphomicrobium sp. TaxID=194373 RepID=UPI0025DFA462|nr:amino acid ABC transporter substrate-binding protein [uncultured Hyphomicrobium sp.]